MFKDCNTLAELNAARIKATTLDDANLVEINNAYNKRRQELLSQRSAVRKLKVIEVKIEPVKNYCGIPLAGRSPNAGSIILTPQGFLH